MKKSKALADEVARWQRRLAPRLPDIDPHDLHLILWSLLRREHGGELRFLLPRRAGGAVTSFDEQVLLKVAQAAAKVKLEFIVTGNAAAAMHGAPVETPEISLFVDNTPGSKGKIRALARSLGGAVSRPLGAASEMLSLLTPDALIYFVFKLPNGQQFDAMRSRVSQVRIENQFVQVASLEDLIAAKGTVGCLKDQQTLEVLKESLRHKRKLEKQARKSV
ncbi:MAG: hypothetical protein FJ388_26015 [Verrucomicrobia bacterium]|nr:hypothetical protein [Verrucomicrobiota bacterium]